MSISLEIVPVTRNLEFVGEPNGSSAYSLSGYVSVTFYPPRFRRNTFRYLLRSLVITFDGQTELVTPDTGYTPYRICSVTKELAPQNPLFELNNEQLDDTGGPCVWNVIFDLAIPGWLPSSDPPDSENGPIAIQYALHATATFVDPEPATTFSYLTCLASPVARSIFPSLFPSSRRSVRANRCDIEIKRFMTPTNAPIPFAVYSIDSCLRSEDTTKEIPSDIFSKIVVTASVPEYVDMESNSFELRLRMRTSGLEPLQCERLRLTSFTVDVHQSEKYRTKPSDTYLGRFSLPPESSQPPKQPLLIPNPLRTLFVIGALGTFAGRCVAVERSFSLLGKSESGNYQLAGDGYIFATDGKTDMEGDRHELSWYAIDPSVNMSRSKGERLRDWAGSCVFRETGVSPLLAVRHEVRVTLFFTYDVQGNPSNRIGARLRLTVPILFTRIMKRSTTPEIISTPSPRPDSSCTTQSSISGLSASPYYAHALPAYSQLFEPNGDRKIDYSLPTYSRHPVESNATELATFQTIHPPPQVRY